MSDQRYSAIPVTVELGAPLSVLAHSKDRHKLEQQLLRELRSSLAYWGLQGDPAVEVRPGATQRALRIRTHGVLQPFSVPLMRHVWAAVAPAELRELPVTFQSPQPCGFPDAWLKAFAADVGAALDAPQARLVCEYITRLTLAIIQRRPSCLVKAGLVQASMMSPGAKTNGSDELTDAASLQYVLASLLDLGVPVERRAEVLQVLRVSQAIGRGDEDTIEAAFAVLRSGKLELHVHPHYLDLLFPGILLDSPTSVFANQFADSLRGPFREMLDELYAELGLELADIVVVPSSESEEDSFFVKIDSLEDPPLRGLQPSESLVHAPPSRLTSLNISARTALNLSGVTSLASIIKGDTALVKAYGFETMSPVSYLVAAVKRVAVQYADRLVSVHDVEYRLARLEQTYPALIQALYRRFSIYDVTRVLRGLAQEGVSSRDLKRVVTRLPHYDVVPVEEPNLVVFDDRLIVPTSAQREAIDNWANYLEFVREGLKDTLAYTFARRKFLELDAALEGRIAASRYRNGTVNVDVELDEAEQEALRDAIWTEIHRMNTTPSEVAILTGPDTRSAVRWLVRQELPELAVLSNREIPSEAPVSLGATIAL